MRNSDPPRRGLMFPPAPEPVGASMLALLSSAIASTRTFIVPASLAPNVTARGQRDK